MLTKVIQSKNLSLNQEPEKDVNLKNQLTIPD